MGHCTPATAATTIEVPPGAPPQGAMSGPGYATDRVWGTEAMAASRATLRGEHGGMAIGKILIDRAEYRRGSGYAWEVQAWHGGDLDKLWLKSEGEGDDHLDRGEVQALWSRAVGPWFDLQAGLRQDFGRGPDRTHVVLAVQGLAPYWFEVEAAAFVSNKGEVSARAEADYDLRLTQRLILQPRLEAEVQAQDVPALRLGSGISRGEIGLRLRYQFVPEFAPYVGIAYERAFGDTAQLRRAAGEARGGWSMLLGVRAWF